MRPIDLARGCGLSTQAIRNYEADGILPAAERTRHDYRIYTTRHAQALRAFLALIPGHGQQTATAIMRAVNTGATDDAFRVIDESHTQLLDDRRTLDAVERALHDLDSTTVLEPVPPRPGGVLIGPLAGKLGIRPATLRQWERAGLVEPHRDPQTGYRVYREVDVRDARLTHQLRRGGYLLAQIAPLIVQVRTAGGLELLAAALCDWRGRLSARGRAMLSGAGELEAYVRDGGSASSGTVRPAGDQGPGSRRDRHP